MCCTPNRIGYYLRVIINLIEWCPKCLSQKGLIPVEDEDGEDCNQFAELKGYRLKQIGANPILCSCGTKLVPFFDTEE
jgi:hypothetical protein